MMRWLPLLTPLLLGLPAVAGQPTKRPPDAEHGKELWMRHCNSCHGPTNHGDGPATAALVIPVPDLAGKVDVTKETIDVVMNGKGPMPGFEASFDREEAKRVLQYMKGAHEAKPLAPKAPTPEAGEDAEGEGQGAGGPG
jgi:mono/diheme cytochrome c family protein